MTKLQPNPRSRRKRKDPVDDDFYSNGTVELAGKSRLDCLIVEQAAMMFGDKGVKQMHRFYYKVAGCQTDKRNYRTSYKI